MVLTWCKVVTTCACAMTSWATSVVLLTLCIMDPLRCLDQVHTFTRIVPRPQINPDRASIVHGLHQPIIPDCIPAPARVLCDVHFWPFHIASPLSAVVSGRTFPPPRWGLPRSPKARILGSLFPFGNAHHWTPAGAFSKAAPPWAILVGVYALQDSDHGAGPSQGFCATDPDGMGTPVPGFD